MSSQTLHINSDKFLLTSPKNIIILPEQLILNSQIQPIWALHIWYGILIMILHKNRGLHTNQWNCNNTENQIPCCIPLKCIPKPCKSNCNHSIFHGVHSFGGFITRICLKIKLIMNPSGQHCSRHIDNAEISEASHALPQRISIVVNWHCCYFDELNQLNCDIGQKLGVLFNQYNGFVHTFWIDILHKV